MNLQTQTLKIVERCLGLPLERRSALADRMCRGRPDLRANVERVLAMEGAAVRLLSTAVDAGQASPLPRESLPDRVGSFRILGRLGEGGMGTVMRAERDDGVFTQEVAIKVLRADLAGPSELRRFALERQILARLAHPSIARILDGGTHAGRPYLVMEYVRGSPITQALNEARPQLETLLDRFEAICDAVIYSHRNLVVHGDIKPSNILATRDGTIKLLDFGVSRLLADLDHDEIAGPYPLTLPYAAPERIAGAPPTIAGDVYALGALLGEMLTGLPPATGGRIAAPLHPAMRKGMAADLQAILAMAMHADPFDRYADVDQLRADLRRCRNAIPLAARPGRPGYVASRFVRRNALALSVATLFTLGLSLATAVSLRLLLDARRAHVAADARFAEVRSLAKFQLFTLYDQLEPLPGTIGVRARLAGEAQKYLDRLARLPNAPPGVRLETARGYDRLAQIQGIENYPNLGQQEVARRNLASAFGILEALRQERPGDGMIAQDWAFNRLLRAHMAIWQDNDVPAGRTLLARAEPVLARVRTDTPDWMAVEAVRRKARADLLGWNEDYRAEVRFAGATLAWLDGLPARVAQAAPFTVTRAHALSARAEGRYYLGDTSGSLADARRADAVLREALTLQPANVFLLSMRLLTGYNLAVTAAMLKTGGDQLGPALELIAIGRRLRALEPEDRSIATRLRVLESFAGQLFAERGQEAAALALQSRAVASVDDDLRRHPGEARVARNAALAHKVMAAMQWRFGNRSQACASWRQAGRTLDLLDREGRLNAWDRTNVAAGVHTALRICSGALPVSAYREGS